MHVARPNPVPDPLSPHVILERTRDRLSLLADLLLGTAASEMIELERSDLLTFADYLSDLRADLDRVMLCREHGKDGAQ